MESEPITTTTTTQDTEAAAPHPVLSPGAAGGAAPTKSPMSDPALRIANIKHLISQAKVLKEAGNALMKQGQAKQALMQYHLAHLKTKGGLCAKNPMPQSSSSSSSSSSMNPEMKHMLDTMRAQKKESKESPLPPALDEELTSLHVSILNNMAVCLGKEESKGERVVALTTEVLSLEPDNFKALLRRCNALVKLGKLAKAEADFALAYKLDPQDKELQRLKAMFDERNRAYEQEEKQRLKGIFDRM